MSAFTRASPALNTNSTSSCLHAEEGVVATRTSLGGCDGVRVVAAGQQLEVEDLAAAAILNEPMSNVRKWLELSAFQLPARLIPHHQCQSHVCNHSGRRLRHKCRARPPDVYHHVMLVS